MVRVRMEAQLGVEGFLEIPMGNGLVAFSETWEDSRIVVQTLNNTKNGSVMGWRLIKEIRRLLALKWEIKVCHSYREANACADALANMGCEHDHGLQIYDQCHVSLRNFVISGYYGDFYP
ncbi:ethylene responsive transcription factor 1b [Trifolium pratense]|uniref:Ethylene responsive transcription factor 1b n=1 Tax=Trifolium pratense TaxID=57577 RepID=A0A2K3JT10_TRIPR|nr:ethylene responsive transcription factor 1b [Trifolium pratense]